MKTKILYIDDNPQNFLVDYLDNLEAYDYDSIVFRDMTYEELLNDDRVAESNIFIIDSKLYENASTSKAGKLTGEEFMIMLKKVFPFKESIIISQVTSTPEIEVVAKFNGDYSDYESYYNKKLLPKIIETEKIIKKYNIISNIIIGNEEIDATFKEKILNSIEGVKMFQEFNTNDIDELVLAIKNLEKKVND